VIRSILHFPRSRRLMAERLSGIGIAYPRASRSEHRLVGTRMPDIDCQGTRFYEVLRSGRFVLVTTAGTATTDWPGVDHAVHADPTLPAAMLVRPDGYIAWASSQPPSAAEMSVAVTRWCGERTESPCAHR
jgi:hypothetical protein